MGSTSKAELPACTASLKPRSLSSGCWATGPRQGGGRATEITPWSRAPCVHFSERSQWAKVGPSPHHRLLQKTPNCSPNKDEGREGNPDLKPRSPPCLVLSFLGLLGSILSPLRWGRNTPVPPGNSPQGQALPAHSAPRRKTWPLGSGAGLHTVASKVPWLRRGLPVPQGQAVLEVAMRSESQGCWTLTKILNGQELCERECSLWSVCIWPRSSTFRASTTTLLREKKHSHWRLEMRRAECPELNGR